MLFMEMWKKALKKNRNQDSTEDQKNKEWLEYWQFESIQND